MYMYIKAFLYGHPCPIPTIQIKHFDFLEALCTHMHTYELTVKQNCCSSSVHLSLHHLSRATVSLGLRNYKQTLTLI